jgi:hypothetical protein
MPCAFAFAQHVRDSFHQSWRVSPYVPVVVKALLTLVDPSSDLVDDHPVAAMRDGLKLLLCK